MKAQSTSDTLDKTFCQYFKLKHAVHYSRDGGTTLGAMSYWHDEFKRITFSVPKKADNSTHCQNPLSITPVAPWPSSSFKLKYNLTPDPFT